MSEMSKIYNLTTENEVMVLTRDRSNKSITISQPGHTDKMLDNYDIPLDTTSSH